MNKKDLIQKFLQIYTDTIFDEVLITECAEKYQPINQLFSSGRITLEENDMLAEAMNSMIDFVIEIIANCPNVQICFNQENKHLPLKEETCQR